MQRQPTSQDTVVMGHDIPKARLTAAGWMWIAIYLGTPLLLVGSLLDALVDVFTGGCSSWWCWF